MRQAIAIVVAIFVGLLPMSGVAQAPGATVDVAGVVVGSCDEFTGTVDFPLVTPAVSTGPMLGSAPSIVAGQSFSSIPLNFSGLLTQTTSLVLADTSGELLACGAIGGRPAADGSINFGVSEIGQSGVAGIAYVAPAGDQTNISLFALGMSPVASAPATESTEASAPVAAAESQATQPLSADEVAYIVVAMADLDRLVNSSSRAADLFSNPRIGQPDWTTAVATELLLWRQLYGDAIAMTPPPRMAEIHATYVESLRLLDSASYDIAIALDTYDVATMEIGIGKIVQAAELMNELTLLIEELRLKISDS